MLSQTSIDARIRRTEQGHALSMTIIELNNLVKSYRVGDGDVQILKGIDLQVREGEFVSIMGPSGSGKSTLAAILGCLSTPTSGTYKLAGHDVSRRSQNELAEIRGKLIGYVYQDFNLLDGISALENVEMPLVYAGVPARRAREKAAHMLDKVGLSARKNHRPNQLSGGQKQRVAIARALVNDPKLIFADEATGALDAKTSFEIMSFLQRLAMSGHTIVQVTHSERDSRFSKRILHIVDGLIVKDEFVEGFTVGVVAADRASTETIVNRAWRVVQHVDKDSPPTYADMKRLLEAGKSVDTLMEAGRALIRFEDNRLSRLVTQLFRHEHWAVRAEVVKACTTGNQDFALGYFIAGLKDENAWVRFLSIAKLRQLAPDLLFVGEDAINKCLGDSDERVRAAAIALVGHWREPGFMPRIVAIAADDPVARVKSNALEALKVPIEDAELVTDAHVAQLSALLEHGHHRVRSTAAVILQKRVKDRCDQTIHEMTNSDSTYMRSAGVWALGQVADERGARILLAMLESEAEEMVVNQLVRSLALCAKGQLSLSEQVRRAIGKATGVSGEGPPSAEDANPADPAASSSERLGGAA